MTQMGKFLLCHRCSKVFKLKLPCWHPTPKVEPKWYLTPCDFMILNAHPHRMLLDMFSPISMRVTPRYFLGSDRSPLFGTGTLWPSFHSSKSISSIQCLLKKSRRWVKLPSLRALKLFVGTLFSPGTLFFVNFITAGFSSSHEMGWSISFMTYLCPSSFSADHSIWQSAQMFLAKCGLSTKALYESVVAVLLSGNIILMMVVLLWWLVSPPDNILTLFHAYLGLKRMEWILIAWQAEHSEFAREMISLTSCYWLWRFCLVKDLSPLPFTGVRYCI